MLKLSRPLLIANGAFVTLGIALNITPPDFSNKSIVIPNVPIDKNTSAPVVDSGTKKHIVVHNSISNNTSGNKPIKNQPSYVSTPTPSESPTKASEPVKTGINGTFAGDPFDAGYGNIQVTAIIKDNQIIDIQTQYPNNGKSGDLNRNAIAILRKETLDAQSANISGVSGASYTSYGYYKSLISALNKAGI